MAFSYKVYGLRVQSDSRIPALRPVDVCPEDGSESVDVRVWLNRLPDWAEDPSDEDALRYRSTNRALTVWALKRNGWYRLQYCDGTVFLVDPQGGEIWSRWDATATLEDTATYLVGPVLGFVLRLRGFCCLHSSAVRVGREIIAFCGRARAGKSTTAAAFAEMGYSVVSDDILAVIEREGTYWVEPGYPRLCLWPDSATALYGPDAPLPRITPATGYNDWWDKVYLDLASGGKQFQNQPLPLSAIYLLDERAEGADAPKVESVPPSLAVVKLAGNTYMNYLLDPDLRRREFQFLGRMAAAIPLRRVTPQADPSCLPRLCEAILADHASLEPKCVERSL